jgi:hypothetical protein
MPDRMTRSRRRCCDHATAGLTDAQLQRAERLSILGGRIWKYTATIIGIVTVEL